MSPFKATIVSTFIIMLLIVAFFFIQSYIKNNRAREEYFWVVMVACPLVVIDIILSLQEGFFTYTTPIIESMIWTILSFVSFKPLCRKAIADYGIDSKNFRAIKNLSSIKLFIMWVLIVLSLFLGFLFKNNFFIKLIDFILFSCMFIMFIFYIKCHLVYLKTKITKYLFVSNQFVALLFAATNLNTFIYYLGNLAFKPNIKFLEPIQTTTVGICNLLYSGIVIATIGFLSYQWYLRDKKGKK
jgi:hypothetical protein